MTAYDYINQINNGEQLVLLYGNDTSISFDENALILAFCQVLQKQYNLKIAKWNPNKSIYPEYMFLGGDRGILAYIKFNVFFDDKKSYFYNLADTVELVSKVESELDRPTFIVNFICRDESRDFFFETTEEIKDRIYTDSGSCDNKKGIYKVNLNLTGNFNEFVGLLKKLKKNNVVLY